MDLLLLRCMNCHQMLLDLHLRKSGICKCGNNRVCGTSPVNLVENMKILWWRIKYARFTARP